MWNYFWKKYKPFSEFRNKSRIRKHLLGNFILKKHTRRFGKSLVDYVTPRRYFWWYVPKEETPLKKTGLFLVSPELQKVAQPPIIYFRKGTRLGLNAYHPLDRITLQAKALGWKSGFWAKALKKTKGCCALYSNTLVSFTPEEIMELHHVSPLKYGGSRSLSNILPLCHECHKEVSIAVASKNIPKIIEFESLGILAGVSQALSTLEPEESLTNSIEEVEIEFIKEIE